MATLAGFRRVLEEAPVAWVGFSLAALAVLLHLPALTGGFIYDDHLQIEQNAALDQPLSRLPEFFRHGTGEYTRSPANYYRPIHLAAYALVASVFGKSPLAFHLLNLALALLAAWLVFLLARRWFSPGVSWLAAVLFLVHPTHMEAVAWIAALPELLTAVLVLSGLLWHLRRAWGPWDYALGAGLLLAGLLTRENALVLPALALLADLLLPERRSAWQSEQLGYRYAAYGLAILAYAAARHAVLGYWVTAPGPAYPLAGLVYGLNVLWVLAQYGWFLLAPPPYSGFHVFHPVLAWTDLRWLAAAAGLALAGWLALALGRRHRPLAFFCWWIPVALLPFLLFRALGDNLVAERYLYLPSVGFAMLVAAGLASLGRSWGEKPRRRLAALAGLALVLMWSGMSLARATVWQDDIRFYRHSLQSEPDAYHFWNLLAVAYDQAGDRERSREIWQTFGNRLPREARPDAATPPTWETIRNLSARYRGFQRSFFEAQEQLAAWYYREGDFVQAAELYRRLLAELPQRPDWFYFLGLCAAQGGRLSDAASAWEQCLRLDPNHPAALRLLAPLPAAPVASLCEQARRLIDVRAFAAAEALLKKAAGLDPAQAQPYHYLFNLYWLTGQKALARQAITEALRRAPDNPLYQHNFRSLQDGAVGGEVNP
jgi:protein O-mannosyl-transferase